MIEPALIPDTIDVCEFLCRQLDVLANTDPEKLRASWRKLAEERGGTPRMVFDAQSPGGHQAAVDFEMGETVVTIQPSYIHGGHSSLHETVVSAPLLVPSGPKFSVRRGSSSSVEQFFGIEDVELSVPDADEGRLPILLDFDERFMVETTEPDETRAFWTIEACDLMLSSLGKALVVKCTGKEIRLTCRGLNDDEDFLNAALELVAELANVDVYGLAELEALPGAVYVPPEGPPDDRSLPYVELGGPTPVILGPVVGPAFTPVTRAEVEGIRSNQKYTVKIDVGKIPRVFGLDSGHSELPPEIGTELRAIGTGTLRVEADWAFFEWKKLELNARRLMAAAQLLRRFVSTTPSNPYR